MTVEAMAFKAGQSVANLVAKRWLAGRAKKAAASAELIELIKTGFSDEIMRRKTENQFEGLAISIAERLLPYTRHELRGLDDGTREAAIQEVVRTLDAADLSDEALLGDNMDPVRLARRLHGLLPARRASFQLGEAGARFYEVILDECCDCLAHSLVHLPEFAERAAAESLARLSDVIGKLDTVLSRLPVRTLDAPEGDSLDREFTRRYLAAVSENLDRMELLGVRFERLTRPQTTLSVAYISLNVTNENPRQVLPPGSDAVAISGAMDSDELTEWLQEQRALRTGRFGTARVEHALSEHQLMLIRGEAGSGKSTLLRWLAITAARGGFTGDLTPFNGYVPFLIKLRSHAGRSLPRPEEFLDDVAPALGGIMPGAWVHRWLQSRRSLLLIDGIDEIVESQRYDVRAWLGELTHMYPGVRIVITSRPAAAEADWLYAEGFHATFLEPLSAEDQSALIQHWHSAMRDSDDLPCPPERLPSYEAKLLARLESAPHLRTLATTPLLAAMLCALNLDHETLPRSRMGLYAAAVDMLLETRDVKRGIPSAQAVRLERDQKVRILRELAWHLSTSNRVELPKLTAQKVISDRVLSMPQVRATGEAVLDSLLQRSGIIREPVPDRIDFIHRTIQEYLTAEHAADIGDMDLLVRNAHLDHWRETIIMAAGHAHEPQRYELIKGILGRARFRRKAGRQLKLLAIACLETVPSVSDDLLTAVDQCLRELIPPTSFDDARSLASAGDLVLRRLPLSLQGLSDETAVATIRAAWQINGAESLNVLRRYTADRRIVVQRELNTAWNYFDPDEYAVGVLSAIPAGTVLTIETPAQLAAVAKVAPLAGVTVSVSQPADLSFLATHADSLLVLYLDNCDWVHDLSPLAKLPKLGKLSILGIAPGADLSPLAQNNHILVFISRDQEVRGAEKLGDRLVRQ